MGVSNYTPTGISHATSVDFSKRSVNQPVHIVQYDKSLPILAVSLYNNGQLYCLSETMEVSIRLGKPDRTFVYNKTLGCDSTRTIVYFEITPQMSLFDGEYYPVIEIMDGDKVANSSTIYLVVDRNPVQHDYIESTIEYKELVDYRDEAVKAGNEAKEAAKIAKDSVQTVVDKTKEAVEASETAVNAANSASESAKSILGVEENVTRIGNMVSEKEPIITAAAETASTSATNAKQSETNAKASEEASKLSETNSKQSEINAKASEEASKLSETNAKESETNAKASADSAKVSETNAKASADSIEEIAKASESYAHGGTGTREGEDTDNARYYMEQAKAVSAVDVATVDKAGIVKPDGTTITVDNDGTLHGQTKVEIMTTDKVGVGKPDGTTITVDEDGTLHGSSSVDEMTGATAEKDGTSGTVPAPTAGQENLFLRGDGTWAEAKQDLSAYYNNANYDTENNKLQLMNGDTVLKEIKISGGGGTKISPKATVNPAIRNGNAKVTITWGDPEDVVADGVILSTWKGTKLVMKETGYPENENDGTVLVDNKTKDAYVSTGYEVTGLTNGNTYYFKLFPYSTDGIYNYQDSNKLLGNPNLVKLDSCTNMSLSLAMGSVTVSWTDPNAEKTVDGNTATWAKTVLVYKQGSTAPSSISDGTVAVEETTRNQYSVDGFTVDGLTDGEQYSFALFAISTEDVSSDATTATANLLATLTITTDETTLYEKEVTVTYGSSTVSGTFSSIGSVTLQIPWIGETTITSTDGTDTATSVVTISAYESTYSGELSFLKIVTFADGTDEEIAAMVNAHYNDKINIADYWSVGDTRTVHLSAMEATGVGESHREQDVEFVIGDFEHDDLETPINGHTKAAVTLLQKDCLMDASNASNPVNGSKNSENGYMNSSNTNVGGWKNCARRAWCNNVFFVALPSAWQSMVKTVNKKVSVGNGQSTIETVQDKIFLAAEIEIFGSTIYSVDGEGTQYQYYKNATANRYKMPKWVSSSVSSYYWNRSPRSGNTNIFCDVYYAGGAGYNSANDACGVAPCLCI